MSQCAVLGAVSLCLAVGCGSTSSSMSAEQFARELVAWGNAGQYGKMYDNLYPAQQRVVPRAKYITCVSRLANRSKRFFGTPRHTGLSVTVADGTKRVLVPGTKDVVRATVMRTRVTVKLAALRVPATGNASEYVVRAGGRSRYIDTGVRAYLKPACFASEPSSGTAALALKNAIATLGATKTHK